jgi:phosphoribosylamine--glycine ligase
MKVLVIGGGGREHALVWKIRQSPKVDKVYCAPGSDGIGELAELVPLAPEALEGLADFAAREKIDLTVVGPELPLTLGLADLFAARGLKVFGPGREAARLEGSKVFAKELLRENGIPTADFKVFDDAEKAAAYVDRHAPCVVKADGLAAGKGVTVCSTAGEARGAVEDIMVRKVFGAAGERVVVEEVLTGEEASFMALVDGDHFLPLASSQDHKRVRDGDEGPNTGGMGAYSPAPVVTARLQERIETEVLVPLLEGLKRRKIRYRGVLYVGLMVTSAGPKVLEFNVRFGDPECQPLMMRLQTDLVPLLEATVAGQLGSVRAAWKEGAAACVVLCARGYPGAYEKGDEIEGLEELYGWSRGFVFHAGSTRKNGRWLTAGGRVLGVTAVGDGIREAVEEAYRAVEKVRWRGMHYRRDIGARAIHR